MADARERAVPRRTWTPCRLPVVVWEVGVLGGAVGVGGAGVAEEVELTGVARGPSPVVADVAGWSRLRRLNSSSTGHQDRATESGSAWNLS
jgi:hypothetical protein